MIHLLERAGVKPPETYREWLDCLHLLRENDAYGVGVYDALAAGSFSGTESTRAALQKQMVDGVNAALDKSAKRFIRNMNDSLAFNEFSQIASLFYRLKRDVRAVLFFESLDFLPKEFREELSDAVKSQMLKFWNESTAFLYEQSLEVSNPDLEDVLFLVKRIKLLDERR